MRNVNRNHLFILLLAAIFVLVLVAHKGLSAQQREPSPIRYVGTVKTGGGIEIPVYRVLMNPSNEYRGICYVVAASLDAVSISCK
jgi:hypothetical protein